MSSLTLELLRCCLIEKRFDQALLYIQKLEFEKYKRDTASELLVLALECKAPTTIIELLLDKGASPNTIKGCYTAPLNLAMYKNYDDATVRLLIERGADVNFSYSLVGLNPWKLLMYKCTKTNGLVTLMLKYGLKYDKDFEADPNKMGIVRLLHVYYRVFPFIVSKKTPYELPRVLFSYMYK